MIWDEIEARGCQKDYFRDLQENAHDVQRNETEMNAINLSVQETKYENKVIKASRPLKNDKAPGLESIIGEIVKN